MRWSALYQLFSCLILRSASVSELIAKLYKVEVKSKLYFYEKHFAPHDILTHEYSSGLTRQASARKMGINLTAVPKAEIIQGIDTVRGILNRCWFDEQKCSQGIKCLESYKKEWNERYGCWASQPLHNWASHCADAFRTLGLGLGQLANKQLTAEDWRKVREKHFPGNI